MSIYRPDMNFLFIHVPRTAGTSMERAGGLKGFMHNSGGHETVRDYDVPEGTFKFSFVRNPWDRFVSAFFCQRPYRGAGQAEFDKFIEEVCVPLVGTKFTPQHGIYISHFDSACHHLLDKDGKIGVDYIGRFEHLQADWRYVCAKIGVFYPLAHHRKFAHDYYKTYYTPESWDIVGKIYQQDIELFGYGSEA